MEIQGQHFELQALQHLHAGPDVSSWADSRQPEGTPNATHQTTNITDTQQQVSHVGATSLALMKGRSKDSSEKNKDFRSSSNVLLRRPSTSTHEDLVIGTVLPTVGLVETATRAERKPPLQVNRSKYSDKEVQIPIDCEMEKMSSKRTIMLPRCDPIPIKFQNICVDVQVQKIPEGHKPHPVTVLLSRLGLGGGGKMIAKRVLFSINGEVKPGRLVALMGSSGAGKSTLLNVLSNRINPSLGEVTYAGLPIRDDVVQSTSAFVQQLDLFINHLTVDEHLQTQVRLRLPDLNKQERRNRIETLCNSLSLVKCRYNQIGTESGVGGISGGERKRLNVASEISTIPAILFADEPTTGLDSSMAEGVASILRIMADSGRTVIATIHQPNSKIFEFFDDVVAAPEAANLREKKLAKIIEWTEKWDKEGERFLEEWNRNGRKSFLLKSQSFLEATFDASFTDQEALQGYSQLEPVGSIVKAMDCRLESESDFNGRATVDEISKRLNLHAQRKIGWCKQVRILLRRAITANSRNKFLIHARAIQTIFLALVYGFLSFRLSWSYDDAFSKAGGAYSLLLNQSFAGAFSMINTFTTEKKVIRREYESGLISSTAYMTAKMLADFPVQVVFPTLFCLIAYYLMGLNDNFVRFLINLAIVLLVSNAAMSIGYFASAIAPGPDIAAVIVNLSVLPLTLFGGFMVKLDDTRDWLSWIQWLSFVRYGFNNMLVTIFRNETVITSNGSMDGLAYVKMRTGFTDEHFGLWFILLAILLIIYRLVSLFAFSILLKRSKENT